MNAVSIPELEQQLAAKRIAYREAGLTPAESNWRHGSTFRPGGNPDGRKLARACMGFKEAARRTIRFHEPLLIPERFTVIAPFHLGMEEEEGDLLGALANQIAKEENLDPPVNYPMDEWHARGFIKDELRLTVDWESCTIPGLSWDLADLPYHGHQTSLGFHTQNTERGIVITRDTESVLHPLAIHQKMHAFLRRIIETVGGRKILDFQMA